VVNLGLETVEAAEAPANHVAVDFVAHWHNWRRKEGLLGGKDQEKGLASYCGLMKEEVAFLLEIGEVEVEVVVLEQHTSNHLQN
jgi:hypothetical protein